MKNAHLQKYTKNVYKSILRIELEYTMLEKFSVLNMLGIDRLDEWVRSCGSGVLCGEAITHAGTQLVAHRVVPWKYVNRK